MEPTDKVSLTYEQLQALGAKMGADIGKAKVLTADDYNANSSNWSDTDPANFNTVALWKLEPGYYVWPESGVTINMTVYDKWQSSSYQGNMARVSAARGGSKRITFISGDRGTIPGSATAKAVMEISLSATTGQNGLWEYPLYFSSIADNLNTTTQGAVLSAKQGKALKDMIDALPTGGMVELTSADYNWPVDSPDGVALWLLSPGAYYTQRFVSLSEGTKVYLDRDVAYNGKGAMFLVGGPVVAQSLDEEEAEYAVPIVAFGQDGDMSEVFTETVWTNSGSSYSMARYYDWERSKDGLLPNMNQIFYEAPTSSTWGVLGQLWTDASSSPIHTYQMTAVDETDPDNPVYTWTQRW